jgi:hypothetical protein
VKSGNIQNAAFTRTPRADPAERYIFGDLEADYYEISLEKTPF